MQVELSNIPHLLLDNTPKSNLGIWLTTSEFIREEGLNGIRCPNCEYILTFNVYDNTTIVATCSSCMICSNCKRCSPNNFPILLTTNNKKSLFSSCCRGPSLTIVDEENEIKDPGYD